MQTSKISRICKCGREINYTPHNHHNPPRWINSDKQAIESGLCASCHRKREQEAWAEYEPYTVLTNFDRYRQMPRAWKKQNPAFHSCIRCKHNPPKIGNYQPRICEKGKLVRSQLFLYYPNDCEQFEDFDE